MRTAQVEGHHADGAKEIITPDGHMRRMLADGRDEEIARAQLSAAVQQPQPVDRTNNL